MAERVRTEQVLVEWHLTPRGWVRGNWSTNKPLEMKVPPPPDRIETWVRIEIAHEFRYAPTQKGWSLTWFSPEHSEAERRRLRAIVRTPAPETQIAKLTVWDFPPANVGLL